MRGHTGMLSCVEWLGWGRPPPLRGALATKQSISPRKGRMDCFASLAKTWMVRLHTRLSSPAKAGDPVRRGCSILSLRSLEYWIVRRSLSSGGHSADPLADDDTGYVFAISPRIAPEACYRNSSPSSTEGAGNAGCALHPRSRAQWSSSCAHEHTGQRRQSDIPCAVALRFITRAPR